MEKFNTQTSWQDGRPTPTTYDTSLQVLFTPGHTNDHISLYLEEEDAVFSGDNVLGSGTAVFTRLRQYMRSLNLVKNALLGGGDAAPSAEASEVAPQKKPAPAEKGRVYPSHGPMIEDGLSVVEQYIQHRKSRMEAVAEIIRESCEVEKREISVEDIARKLYPAHVLDNPGLFMGAVNNTRLVCQKFLEEGQVVLVGNDTMCLPEMKAEVEQRLGIQSGGAKKSASSSL